MAKYQYDPSLYSLSSDYENLMYLLLDPEADEETVIDTLDSIESLIDHKAENYGHIISALSARADFMKSEEQRLAKTRSTLENRVGTLKATLFDAMKAVGKSKIQTDHYTVAIQKNGGKRALDIYAEVPDEYTKSTVSPDNDLIREALEAGEELEFACLKAQGESLRIR